MLSKHRLSLFSRTGLRRRKWCPAWRCSQDLNLKRDFVLFKLQDERWALPDLNRHPGYYEQPALTIELRARKGRPEQESNLYQAGRNRRFFPLNYRV